MPFICFTIAFFKALPFTNFNLVDVYVHVCVDLVCMCVYVHVFVGSCLPNGSFYKQTAGR